MAIGASPPIPLAEQMPYKDRQIQKFYMLVPCDADCLVVFL